MSIRSLSLELDLDAGRFTASMNAASGATTTFSRNIDDASRRLGNIERAVASPMARLRDLTLILGNVREAFGLLHTVVLGWAESMIGASASIERTSKMLEGMSAALDDIGKKKDAQKQMDFIFSMAKSAPFSLGALTDAFVKLKSTGLDPMDGTLRGIVEAVARFGGSDQQLDRAALAIQQMAGKGVISMEELRRQLGEAVPTAINMMAAGMGMSYAQLTKAITTGQVESKEAIAKMIAMFNLAYGGSALAQMQTFAGKLAVLKTGFLELSNAVTGLNRDGTTIEGGFLSKVKDGLDAISQAMSSPEVRQFGLELGRAMSGATDGLIAFSKTVVNLGTTLPIITLVKDALIALAAVLTIQLGRGALQAITGWLSTARNAFMGMGSAITLFRSEMAALNEALAASAMSMANVAAAETLTAEAMAALGRATLNLIPVVGTILFTLYTAADAFGLFKNKVDDAKQAVDDFNHTGFTTQAGIDKQAGIVADAAKELEDQKKALAAGGIITESGLIPFSPKELADQRLAVAEAQKNFDAAKKVLDNMQKVYTTDRYKRAGNVSAQFILTKGDFAKLNQQSADLQNAFAAERKMLDDQHASKEEYTQATAAYAAKMKTINDAYIANLRKTIAEEQKIAATLPKTSPDYGAKQAEIAALNEELKKKLQDASGIGHLEGPNNMLNGGGSGKPNPVAEKIAQMRSQLAGLTAQLDGAGVASAKLNATLAVTGTKLSKATPEQTKEMQALAASIDAAQEALKGKKADDRLTEEVKKQSDAAKIAHDNLQTLIDAQGKGALSSAEYAANMDKLADKASEFDKNAQGAADAAKKWKAQVDAFNQSSKNIQKLGEQVTGARAEANGLFDELMNGNDKASLTLQRYKKTMEQLVEGVIPEFRQQARGMANDAIAAFSQVEALKAAQDMRAKVKSINAELELDAATRSHMETQTAIDDMNKRIDWARLTADQRKMVEKDFYDYVGAMRARDAQRSKGPLAQMADQWAQLGINMQQAATGWVGSFVDGIATGKLSMKDFVSSVLEGIAKVILQALIAKAIIAALGAFAGPQVTPASVYSDPGFNADLGSIAAATHHSGGIVGKEPTSILTVSPEVFRNAFRYHVGGLAGLKPKEVPAVLKEGEGVFTKEQMAAMGETKGKAPNVTVNVINQSGTPMSAQQKGSKFDAKGMIVDVVVDALSKPGKMRDAVKGTQLS